jgi:AraC-like DNA-binding protein
MENWIFSIFPNETFIDLSLYQFGWEKCNPSHSFGPSARNHYLFHYVISGTGKLEAEDSKGNTHIYQVRSGQGFMIFPDQIVTYTADHNLPWEYVWLEFDGLRVKEAIELAGLSVNVPIYRARSKSKCDDMFREMMYIVEHKDESPLHIVGHLYLFLDYMTRSSMNINVSKGSKLQDFYLKESISFIEKNFQNDISIEDIASFCGLNRTYFGKIFKRAVGKTPQEFLLNYRMIKATELLKLTHLSIGDISNAVGYSDQLHFSRAFKKIYGVSPRNWRKENIIRTPGMSSGQK